MKLTGAKVETFLRTPDPAVRVILVYGPDRGLVRERLKRLVLTVVEDAADPFRVVELSPAALKDDSARLVDEARAIALTGGRRVVIVRDAADTATAAVKLLLSDNGGDALILLEAGELAARSSLRLACETANNAAALPCYGDEGAALHQVIREELKAASLTPDSDALDYLLTHLGGDRRLTRNELRKLVIYMGGPGTVSLADVMAVMGDSASLTLDDLVFATADGQMSAALSALDRLLAEGNNPVAILRALARHWQRLHLAQGLVAQGQAVDQAMRALKPPVFYKFTDRFRAQISRWSIERLNRALGILLEAETACKSTGAPMTELCGRAIMQLAQAAGRPR